jgi:hypothetical protein
MLDVTLFRWCSAQRVRAPVAGSALAGCLASHKPQVLPAIIATLGSGTVASGRAGRMASGSCWLRKAFLE